MRVAVIGGTGGYVFNLQTKGLGQGGYDLIFTVNGAPAASPASFKIR